MNEIHYLISDASKKVDVEAHVLRYWEEELKLDIPRNDMGHRYYINDQKIPLEENDHYGTSSNGRVRTFKLTMVK